MSGRERRYSTDRIAVRFDARRCIHSAECVFGLPTVFDPERRPWIDPEAAQADAIARVITRCPTGALHFDRLDGGDPEAPDAENRVRVMRNGPLHVRGVVELHAADGAVVERDVRVSLCRCGASQHPPFCDNSHRAIRFVDSGELFERPLDPRPEAPADRTLRITGETNGPLRVEGPFAIASFDGRVQLAAGAAKLCRCGASRSKPFCDGSHELEGFTAP